MAVVPSLAERDNVEFKTPRPKHGFATSSVRDGAYQRYSDKSDKFCCTKYELYDTLDYWKLLIRASKLNNDRHTHFITDVSDVTEVTVLINK